MLRVTVSSVSPGSEQGVARELTSSINIQRLLSGRRMRPDQRMFILDRLPPDHASPLARESRLFKPTMHGRQAMQPLLQALTQPVIRLDLACKQRVTANLGRVKDIQERNPRRLFLIADIGVPGYAAVAAREEGLEVRSAWCGEPMDDV